MTQRKTIAIYGAGGSAREVAWLIAESYQRDELELVGFIQDRTGQNARLNGLPVVSLDALQASHPDALLTVAVGNPMLRRKLVANAAAKDFAFATLVHRGISISGCTRIGPGSVIACGSILTVDVELGQHVHVNVACTISHDVRIGNYSTLSPGVHLCGNVHVGERVFVGTGANVINGSSDRPLVIGDGSVIAAGACVTSSVEPNTLYAGVPAVLKKYLDISD